MITVNISLSATIGGNSISVTAGGVTSNSVGLTANGAAYMVVQSDLIGTCEGCSTTVARYVTYQIFNADGAAAGAIPVCEALTQTGWSCNQTEPPAQYAHCSAPYTTSSSGTFTDEWSLGSDGYTPSGCGDGSLTDHWQWAASPTVQKTFATLTGYTHTNAVSINGVVNPPNQLQPGTRIGP